MPRTPMESFEVNAAKMLGLAKTISSSMEKDVPEPRLRGQSNALLAE